MNQLNEQQMDLHVKLVGWLQIASHAIFLLIGGFVFLLLTGIGVSVRDNQAPWILFLVGTGIATFLAALAIPGMLAGIGLLMRQSWGRILAIIIAILGLFNFPLGTLIGVYTLWVLLQDAAGPYFAGRRPAGGDLTPRTNQA